MGRSLASRFRPQRRFVTEYPDLKAVLGTACPYCDRPMSSHSKATSPTRDHIVPRTYGGKLTEGNKLIVCSRCNYDKGHKTLEEFEAWLLPRDQKRAKCVRRLIERFKMENEGSHDHQDRTNI